MIAEYVMRGIDNLFTDKLTANNNNSSIIPKPQQPKSSFNRDIIKHSLNSIIKRGPEYSKSPSKITRQPSPISKSRLKDILQHNKEERLRSVVKRAENVVRQTSPYQKIDVDGIGQHGRQAEGEIFSGINKENNVIRYYRQARKSTEKTQMQKSQLRQGKKSRIFNNNSLLSRNTSNGDFRLSRI